MLALYRKYRPSTLSDLVGQEIVVRIIQEAARRDRLAHAYLFSGPRGTGKTTTARLVAKLAVCMKRVEDEKFRAEGEPCNACLACASIDRGNAMDVIEIDAASNRGIDEMRNLKESVRTAPSSLARKVFIIDEAHMLTKDAANALLKTLEEPPPYVIIILATTELEKIPPTIASRAQTFRFRHATLKELMAKLKKVIAAEKIKISDEALECIASLAEGSFRDAESMLDQMASLTGKEITLESIEETLGTIGFRKVASLAEKLLMSDLESALALLADIANRGYNLVELTKDLLVHLRRTAVLKYNPGMKARFEEQMMKDHLALITTHAALFTDRHLDLLKNLIAAYGQMRYSQFPIIPLEIALIESLKKPVDKSH